LCIFYPKYFDGGGCHVRREDATIIFCSNDSKLFNNRNIIQVQAHERANAPLEGT
jgi:hypothetical protein